MLTGQKCLFCVAILASANVIVPGHSSQTQSPARGFVEEMRIVSDDHNPAMTLTMPNHLAVNNKGWIFTSHEDEGIVRVFDGTGKYLRSLGRKGNGPGEFARAFNFFATVGDTVIMYDFSSWSLVWYLDTGTYLRTVPIARLGNPPRNLLAGSYLGDGRMFAYVTYFGGRGSSNQSDSTEFWLAETSGRVIKRLFALGAIPSSPVGPTASGAEQVRRIYGYRVYHVTRTFGQGMVLRPHTLFGGTADQLQIVRYDRDGNATERVVTLPTVAFTSVEREELVKMMVASVTRSDSIINAMSGGRMNFPPRTNLGSEIRAEVSRLGTPPVLQAALAGPDGSLWIMSMRHRRDWTVLTESGMVAYRVRIPLEKRVLAVNQDRFWAIEADMDGLPVITRNRVR